jgi:hypothetical protein
MLLHDFSDRAEEYVRLAQRAKTPHDKDLFTEMARAWFGIKDDAREPSTLQDAPVRH